MIKKTTTSRSQRANRTRNKIYKSATKLIEKYGFDTVTIEDISKNAGVSVGAFYHYFSSKNDILLELFKQIDTFFDENKEKILSGKTAAERIESLFWHYATFHSERGLDHTGLILRIRTAYFNDRNRNLYTLLEDIVEQGREAGEFVPDYDTDTIAHHILLVARGVLLDWVWENAAYDFVTKMAQEIRIAVTSLSVRQS